MMIHHALWFKTLIKALMGALMVTILALVFMFHYQPDVLIALSNQVWACF